MAQKASGHLRLCPEPRNAKNKAPSQALTRQLPQSGSLLREGGEPPIKKPLPTEGEVAREARRRGVRESPSEKGSL